MKQKFTHDKMLEALVNLARKFRIEDKDIKTKFSSINPVYDYINGMRKFRSYIANTKVTITMRDTEQTGLFQDNLLRTGIDNFEGPLYTLDKIQDYHDKVLQEAAANAKGKSRKN